MSTGTSQCGECGATYDDLNWCNCATPNSKPQSESGAREFWISPGCGEKLIHVREFEPSTTFNGVNNWIHTVEISALRKAEAERDEALKFIREYAHEDVIWQDDDRVRQLKAELAQLRISHDTYQRLEFERLKTTAEIAVELAAVKADNEKLKGYNQNLANEFQEFSNAAKSREAQLAQAEMAAKAEANMVDEVQAREAKLVKALRFYAERRRAEPITGADPGSVAREALSEWDKK